jgi:hypothetical protein
MSHTATRTASNGRDSVIIKMTGGAMGVCRGVLGATVVRETTDGRFAVVAAKGHRLFRVFDDPLHARRYNFAIQGQRLGE